MRKFGYLVAAMTAGLLAAAAGPALAATPVSSATPVLSYGSLGGPAVAAGDLVTSSLDPGTVLSLTSAPSGSVGLFCKQSVFGAVVTSNPALPGPAVLQVLNPLTISSCTDNAPTVTGVAGVGVSGLPATLQVIGVAPYPLTLTPGSSPLQISVSLNTTGGAVTCVYQSPGPLNGNTSLGSAAWRFLNQPFKLVSAPVPACGNPPIGYLTAAYAPVIDTSKGGQNVFVN
jgi:hypothetical protein